MDIEKGILTDILETLESVNDTQRVYVEHPTQVPDSEVPQRGPSGGWYYETRSGGSDNVLDEVIEIIVEQILPTEVVEDVAEEDLQQRVEERLTSIEQFSRSNVEKAITEVVTDMTEKVQPERVYVSGEEQVPEEYEMQEDEHGDLYYERVDAEHIPSGRTSQKTRVYVSSPEEVPEQYEVREGDRGGFFYETGTESDRELYTSAEQAVTDVIDEESEDVLQDEDLLADEIHDRMMDDLGVDIDMDDEVYDEVSSEMWDIAQEVARDNVSGTGDV